MEPISQYDAWQSTDRNAREHVAFWRASRFDALECLAATFRTHEYAQHTHATYVVGVIERGCETFHVRGVRHFALPGDVCFVNPDEVHDGSPAEDGYSYRMTYPSIELMTSLVEDMTGRPADGTPSFVAPIVHDPELARRFSAAHRRLGAGDGALSEDEGLTAVYAEALARYAKILPRRAGRESAAIRTVIDYLDAHYADDVTLPELARISGLSRTGLIRAFKSETGLTPHSWLTDRRIRAARIKLATGMPPGAAALACGFYDQSHLNRAFKARVGVTPGAYRRP